MKPTTTVTPNRRPERRTFVLAAPESFAAYSGPLLDDALNDALIHLFTLRQPPRPKGYLDRVCYDFWRQEWPEAPFNPDNYQDVNCYCVDGGHTVILSCRSRF